MNLKLHRARKRFGQNFLHDKNVIQQIIQAIHPKSSDRLVEIGPGLAALTTPLLSEPEVTHLDAIEIDKDLALRLINQFQGNDKFTLHQGDALKFDFASLLLLSNKTRHSLSSRLRIFGNLPYNISTPLIFHLLEYTNLIQDMHFMLQKEVVNRITANPGNKDYGRLSVMTQYYCQTYALFDIHPDSFAPVPAVTSTLIRLIPHAKLPFPAHDFSLLQIITTAAFNQRRKTIANSLKPYLSLQDFSKMNIDSSRRPETLSLKEFVMIANYVASGSKITSS